MATSNDDRISSSKLATFATKLWTKLKATFYTKPSTGIPKDDLASDVQTSLTNADTHVADTDIHITAAERTAWNAKQDALTIEDNPSAGSANPVKGGGIVTYVTGIASAKLNTSGNNATAETVYQILNNAAEYPETGGALTNGTFAYHTPKSGTYGKVKWGTIIGWIKSALGITVASDGTKTFDGTATKATYNSNGEVLDDTYIRKDGTNDDDISDKNPSGFHRILWNNTTESYSAQNTGDYFVYIKGDVSSTSYAQRINAENLSKVMQSCIESRNTLKAYSATTATTCTGNSATADTAKNCSGTASYATQAGTCSGNSATATYAAFASNLQNSGMGTSSFNSIRPDDNNGCAVLKIYVTKPSLGATILCSTRSPSGYPLVFSIAFTWTASGWGKVPKRCYLYTTSQDPTNTTDLGSVEVKYGTTTMTLESVETTVGTIFIRLPYSSSVSGSGSTGNRIFSLVSAKDAESIYFEEVNATDTDYVNATDEASGEGTVCTSTPGTAKGSSSNPVYVDASGFVTPCDFKIEIKSSGTISTDANTVTFVTFSS